MAIQANHWAQLTLNFGKIFQQEINETLYKILYVVLYIYSQTVSFKTPIEKSRCVMCHDFFSQHVSIKNSKHQYKVEGVTNFIWVWQSTFLVNYLCRR